MEFAICFKGFVQPDRARYLVRQAEDAGFTYCWFYDSHILWRESFMAIGMRDGVLGEPVMDELRGVIRGCPEPMKLSEAGHFVQEYGEPVARSALESFGIA